MENQVISYLTVGKSISSFKHTLGSVVSVWQIAQDGMSIQRLEFVSTGSQYTAHLLVDKSQSRAYAANYGGSTFSVIKLNNEGSLGELDVVMEYGEGCRDASHPHQTFSRGNMVWVVDLGCDRIRHYRLDSDGALINAGETVVRAGAGPRHAVFHPTRNLMFLLCELQSYVQVYR